jgi:hypothetical protein
MTMRQTTQVGLALAVEDLEVDLDLKRPSSCCRLEPARSIGG